MAILVLAEHDNGSQKAATLNVVAAEGGAAAYGLVADLFQPVPELTAALG